MAALDKIEEIERRLNELEIRAQPRLVRSNSVDLTPYLEPATPPFQRDVDDPEIAFRQPLTASMVGSYREIERSPPQPAPAADGGNQLNVKLPCEPPLQNLPVKLPCEP